MIIKVFKKGKNLRLSENFTLNEFVCKGGDCNQVKLDMVLIDFLQKIRNHFGRAVNINSAFRCEAHNKRVKGSKNSYHLKGAAADITVSGVAPLEVAKYAESIGIKGIGLYDSFVHIDTRENKSFWYSDKQQPRDTFTETSEKSGFNVKAWQTAAIADGFSLPSGADGIWGSECEAVARKAVLKLRKYYKYKNLTKIAQAVIGTTPDGLFGEQTRQAVINWQTACGLTPDGAIGIKSWNKMRGN